MVRLNWVSMVKALLAATIALGASLAFATSAHAQKTDFPKTDERNDYITKTPEFQERLQQQTIEDQSQLAAIAAAEAGAFPGDQRDFSGNVCAQRKQECAGDVRLYEWEANGFGSSEELLFGGRSGATLSGKVWATREGPAKRPGIVITTGSVQAPEVLYWSFAQVLAKRGYVVLTYDVQGQGRSDTYGEGVDRNEGVPSQAGQPFYDGTEDALDFLLSTEAAPYDPRPSCGNANGGTRTDHGPKHERRIAAGLNAPFNPFWELVDPERIGIAGHSLGAGAVSYIGQIDDRVDAIVGWDNLGTGSSHPACGPANATRPDDPPLTKPAIGMSNDYGLFPSTEPGPKSSSGGAFQAFKDAGTDSMQINRRGGTHYEYSYIPGETAPDLGLATLRGNDMAIWYTVAWFDRYVKCQGDPACQAEADKMLLTDRWRDDEREGQVDYGGDPNLYSKGIESRFDFMDASGSEQVCDDVRTGCANLADDGAPAGYDFLDEVNTADGDGPGPDPVPDPDGPEPCTLPRIGTDADDDPNTLPPTDAGDAIRGLGGDDRIRGGLGPDCLNGNGGNDIVKGDDDDDEVRGGGGKDRVIGGDGDDTVRANRGRDKAKGGKGDDFVSGGKGRDQVIGGPGKDVLAGGDGNDVIKAADGEKDKIICNKGKRDKVMADRKDKVGAACDKVRIVKK